MLAKEIFACFLFIFSSFAQNVRRIVHFEPSSTSTSSFRLKPKPKPRPNPNPCARPGCPCCPRQDCSCCCHSSIFVSLCSIRLKDCNIYLHLFSSLFFSCICICFEGRRTKDYMGYSYIACIHIGMLCTRWQQQQQQCFRAMHFDFGICGFLCNSWSFNAFFSVCVFLCVFVVCVCAQKMYIAFFRTRLLCLDLAKERYAKIT